MHIDKRANRSNKKCRQPSAKPNLLTAAIVSGLVMSAPFVDAAAPSVEQLSLQQKLEQLQQQVAQLQQAMATQKQGQPISAIDVKKKKKSIFGETQIQVGGYMKLDSHMTEYSDGGGATAGIGEDFLVPSTIPVGGEKGSAEYHSHAKTSRLFVKSHTETETGYVKTHFEFDAVGSAQGDERITNSYAERVRHAYVDWQIDENNALLAGQTWSTFFNVGALPEGLDFVGPVGTVFERQPQLRYTRKLGSGSLQVSAENPASTLYNGAENPYDDNGRPDMIARYNGKIDNFSYSIAAMTRELRCEDGSKDESESGTAFSVAGKYFLDSGDDIRFMFNYGDALGRYMSLNGFRAGVIEPDGSIELIDQMGGFVALRHFWNDQWRSNFVVSASKADNPDTVADTVASDYQSVHFNLLYSPISKLTLGGEYMYATKEVENVSGALDDTKGSMKRLQFSMKYAF